MKSFNRVYVTTPTTGTGDTITLGSAISTLFLTLAQAGGAENNPATVVVEDGDDFGIYKVTVGASAATIEIDSVVVSKIGGTPGTSKLDLSGSATVRFVEDAAFFNARMLGAMLPYTGAAEPDWGVFPDGATYNRADYPSWWDWIENESGNLAASEGAKTAGQYGPGDESTTFTIPDLASANRYIRMADGTTLACGDLQTDAFQGHFHSLIDSYMRLTSGFPADNGGPGPWNQSSALVGAPSSDGTNGTPRTASETRPITVAYPFVIVHGGLGT